MSIKKQQLKSKPVCKVTFRLPKEETNSASKVNLVGEFNNWDREATPMRRQKDGTFTMTLDLEAGREYQFRYLLNGEYWENDRQADKYAPTPYGDSENCVVVTKRNRYN